MNESGDRLAASVDDVFDAFEWSPLGFREYQDVTAQGHLLQDKLIDHLYSFDHLGEYDENEELAMVYTVSRQIERDFNCLDGITVGDELLMYGSGLVMVFDDTDDYGVIDIDQAVRLHGKVVGAVFLEVPELELAASLEEGASVPTQLSAALELDTVSLEDKQPDGSQFHDLPDGCRVFLPMVYSDVKIKRRVDSMSLED